MRDEIRSRFKDYSEITSSSVGQLPYFHAVLNETMRLYPPVPFGPPRISPGAYVDGHYVPKKVGARVNSKSIISDVLNRQRFQFMHGLRTATRVISATLRNSIPKDG